MGGGRKLISTPIILQVCTVLTLLCDGFFQVLMVPLTVHVSKPILCGWYWLPDGDDGCNCLPIVQDINRLEGSGFISAFSTGTVSSVRILLLQFKTNRSPVLKKLI